MAKKKTVRRTSAAAKTGKAAVRATPLPKGKGKAKIIAKPATATTPSTDSYKHADTQAPLRPDVGTQPRFKSKKKPRQYRYDSSLAPSLEWDEGNPAREQAEAHLAQMLTESAAIAAMLASESAADGLSADDVKRMRERLGELQQAAEALKAMSGPFLNWAGKAERPTFNVPTLPLFVHERLSTRAIIETLSGHKKDEARTLFDDLFADPNRSIADQVLRPYEHGPWTNRMILGDSLVVMNSLLEYEGMGGQVQMIYMAHFSAISLPSPYFLDQPTSLMGARTRRIWLLRCGG